MKIDFRHQARDSLKRAKIELDSNDDDRLKYAALDLRMIMEALTYDRLQAYKAEIPEKEFQKWQPKKIMQLLLDIDPKADQKVRLDVGLENTPGEQAKDMKSLGTETVLNMKVLKKHYDALGSYLHIPTIKQFQDGLQHDLLKLRSKCIEIAEFVEVVLKSPIFNVTIGNFSTIECMRCNKPIRRRIPFGAKKVNASCLNCGANYTIREAEKIEDQWYPSRQELNCPSGDCDEKILVWADEIKTGTWWTCKGCGKSYRLGVGIFLKE